MATLKIKVQFTLDDYFQKFGFGDGGDADAESGAAYSMGWGMREKAVDLLNAELKKRKLPITAISAEVGGMHNNCQIELRGPGGWTDVIDWEPDDTRQLVVDGVPNKQFSAAYDAAWKKFEKYVEAYK